MLSQLLINQGRCTDLTSSKSKHDLFPPLCLSLIPPFFVIHLYYVVVCLGHFLQNYTIGKNILNFSSKILLSTVFGIEIFQSFFFLQVKIKRKYHGKLHFQVPLKTELFSSLNLYFESIIHFLS